MAKQLVEYLAGLLFEAALEVHTDMSPCEGDTRVEYEEHWARVGRCQYQINNYKSIAEIHRAFRDGDLEEFGYPQPDCDEDYDRFFELIALAGKRMEDDKRTNR